MTYIVNDACIKCKYTDCVAVCPVDCFYEGANMLVIDPDGCIDCGVCEPECPAGAIVPDTNLSDNDKYWLKVNTEYSKLWPNIYQQKEPLPDAEQWDPTKGYTGNKNEFFDPSGPENS